MKKKPNKFNAKSTVVDGYPFPSKLEADLYIMLRELWNQGRISYFLRQVPIQLAPGKSMRIDFMVVRLNGEVRYLDAKGRATPEWTTKREWAHSLYPLTIESIGRRDFINLKRELIDEQHFQGVDS